MIFAAVRYFLIGVLLVLNIATLVLATSVFSIADSNDTYQAIYVYIIFLSAFSCVFLIPIALIDYFRRGAIPSRVLFELGWLVLFWILHLAAASALTAAPPCQATESCNQAQHVMLVFSWMSVSVLLIHLATLLFIALMHMNNMPRIWSMDVRDYPWFASRDKPNVPDTQQLETGIPAGQPTTVQQPRRRRDDERHGRNRSSGTRSWRDRYPSENFVGPTEQEPQPPLPNSAGLSQEVTYPFAGQAQGVGNPEPPQVQQPAPVAFTFERSRPSAEQQQQQQNPSSSRAPAQRENGRALYNQQPTQSRVRRESGRNQELPSIPLVSQDRPQPSSSRAPLPLPPPPSASKPVASGSRPRQRPPRQSLPNSNDQAQAQQPPADSLLFSSLQPELPPQPTASTSQPRRSREQRSRLQPPPPSFQPQPDTTAFYSSHIQSVLRPNDEPTDQAYDGMADDGRSSTRRVYASAPKPKPMSEAQAYAEASRRARQNAAGPSGWR